MPPINVAFSVEIGTVEMTERASHGFARIVSMSLRPGTIDPAFDRFRVVSTPLVRVQPGSIGILGAARREPPHGYAISFWESREHLELSNANPRVVEAMMGYAGWMDGPFSVGSFDIVAGAPPPPWPETGPIGDERARMTTAVPRRGCLDAVVDAYRDYLARLEGTPGCIGTLLLTPHVGERVIAIELWSSMPPMPSVVGAPFLDRAAWNGGPLENAPTREMLEILGRY